jgi:hypothetical protein
LEPGAHGFKLATEDWRTIDLGARSSRKDNVTFGKPLGLTARGLNLRLWVDDAGEYEFVLDAGDGESARVMVVPVR